MRQAIMTEPGKIEINEVPAPDLNDDGILLKIQRIGVCGSDIHVYHGKHPYTSYPVIQGHEFSAVVEAVGKNVKGVKVGTKVTARPQVVCGQCKRLEAENQRLRERVKELEGEMSMRGLSIPGVRTHQCIVGENNI